VSIYLELDGQGEMYRQLLRALRQAMAEGRLPVGTRLPSTRALAEQLGIARNTVLLAYEMLCAEHLAVSKVGSGTYVVRPPRRVPDPPAELAIEPPSRFARRLRETDTQWFRDPGKHLRFNLQYGTPVVEGALWPMPLNAPTRPTRPPRGSRPCGSRSLRTWADAAVWPASPTT
jgi:DNA-binding transcriptional regulator YhcF (GntR family)